MKKTLSLILLLICSQVFANFNNGHYQFDEWGEKESEIFNAKRQLEVIGQDIGVPIIQNTFTGLSHEEGIMIAEVGVFIPKVKNHLGQDIQFNFKFKAKIVERNKSFVAFEIEEYRSTDFMTGHDDTFTIAHHFLSNLLIGQKLRFNTLNFQRIGDLDML